MKNTYKILSVILAMTLLLSTMPLSLLHVSAEDFEWNSNATMTLTTNNEEVAPANIIETDDTKLKVYTIDSDKPYTLTTSSDNDYGVVFDIVWVKITDEYGNEDYDREIDITLDNVTIKTINPRQSLTENNYAAMNFCSTTAFYNSNTINIHAVGTNTIELLGVKNDTTDDNWSAVCSTNDMLNFCGDGTINAGCTYNGAVGSVAAIRNPYTVYTKDSVTLNATANVTNTSNEPVGYGILFSSYSLVANAGTKVNVIANKCGIYNTYKSSPNLFLFGDMNIKAGECGINWETSSISVGDDATLTIEGLTDTTSPKVGIITKRGVAIGNNCIVNIKALNEALSCKATTVEDHSAPVSIGENSVVNLSGSFESPVFALDCGLDGGSNNYWSSYPASDLDLAANAKLTVNAGYLAIQAYTMDMMSGSVLNVTTTKQVDSSNAYDYAPVRLYTNSYIESGATINIDSAAKSAIYSGKLHLKSNNIFIKALEEVFVYTSFTRYENVCTFECDDGINWVPFDSSSNGRAYFTTNNVENHICYGSTWTQVDDTYTHSTTCIYCGKTLTENCIWNRGAWNYVSSGVYELKFTCNVCKAVRISDVAYHSHTYETYTPFVDKNGQFKHEGYCTYDGCEASTEEYCSNYLGEEYHINPTTLIRDCTKCGQHALTTEIEAGTSAHFDAKSGSCNTPGNIEYYSCGHCSQYYADEAFTTKLSPTDIFTTPEPHKYDSNGVCSVCGNKEQTLTFTELDERPYDYHNYNLILIGKTANGDMYVMGNTTTDGKRVAVKINASQIDENGNIKISSADAEYLLWDNMNNAFIVDGGCLSMLDGKIYVYDTDRKNDSNISMPAEYCPEEYGDESGLGYMEAYVSGHYNEREIMIFNEDTLTFETSDTQVSSLYLYVEVCEHLNLSHQEYVAPTCTEQGIREYWYCGKCHSYFSNEQGSAPLDLPEHISEYNIHEYLTLQALNHNYGDDGICKNCDMKRPVYTQISSLDAFDKLDKETSYIFVIKDGDKTYAASLPNFNNPCDIDTDGDGIVDALEIDENANAVPDCFEAVYNNWGMGDFNGDEAINENDYKEWIGDQTEDGIVDIEDYKLFLEYNYWDVYSMYEEQAMRADNFVEVTLADDGSITLTDEGAMELQMMISGVWGGQDVLEGDLKHDWEYYGILDTERVCAAWIPNIWIANSGMMGNYSEDHFMTQNRYYGDYAFPGIIDNKNWKISFNSDGTACLVSTWAGFDNTAALQFVKYTNADGNDDMTIVGMYGDQWEYSDIMINKTAVLPVYLFASEPQYNHIHNWSDWEKVDEDTHKRTCSAEGCKVITQTAEHVWDNGTQTEAATCITEGSITYTCTDCGATKVETIDALGHDWSTWNFDSVDSHVRYCKRNCGTEEFGAHDWSDWTPNNDGLTHTMTCLICDGSQTEDHNWDAGTVTKEPTEYEEGITTFTCSTCGAIKTAPIDKLEHEHNWSDWAPNDDKTHIKSCRCNETITEQHNFDNGVVTQAPTHISVGEITYTCLTCGYSYTNDIPASTEHEWSDWYANDNNTHSRSCCCNAVETKDCTFDDGVVVEMPTHTEYGILQFTCTVCDNSYTQDIPVLDEHEWSEWVLNENDESTHIRSCICNATETASHIWSDWNANANGGYNRICADCGYMEDMFIPEDKPVNTTPTDNAANTTLDNTDIEIIDKVLTDEEQSQVAAGSQVTVYLKVEDITETVPTTEKEAAQDAAGDNQIGMYLDIDMFKKVDTDETQVTKTSGNVTITISIPEELINTTPGITRTYQIIRVHDDGNGVLVIDVIDGKYNPEDNTFTFETDKFSTYALSYSDEGEAICYGDVNNDDSVNNKDLALLMQYINGWDIVVDVNLADVNADSAINNKDYALIMRSINGWDVTLGPKS